jgi:hypothetical protein
LSSESDVTQLCQQQHHHCLLENYMGRRVLWMFFLKHSKQRYQAWHVKPCYYITKCARDGYHIRVLSRGASPPSTPPLYTISPRKAKRFTPSSKVLQVLPTPAELRGPSIDLNCLAHQRGCLYCLHLQPSSPSVESLQPMSRLAVASGWGGKAR